MTDALTEYLLALEDLAWEARNEGDADFYRTYLTDDAVAVASYGRFDKTAILAAMAQVGTEAAKVSIHAAHLLPLGPDVALLSYHAMVEVGEHGFGMYATTGYVRRDGVWHAAFQPAHPHLCAGVSAHPLGRGAGHGHMWTLSACGWRGRLRRVLDFLPVPCPDLSGRTAQRSSGGPTDTGRPPGRPHR